MSSQVQKELDYKEREKYMTAQEAIEALLASLGSDEARASAKSALERALAQDAKVTAQKQWQVTLDRIAQGAQGIIAKSGLDLANHTIRLSVVEGKLTASLSGASAGGGQRNGNPGKHGRAYYNGSEYASPSTLAKTLGLQISGRRDMIDVFQHGGKYTVKNGDGRFEVTAVAAETQETETQEA